jgi:hypothetical protein
MRISIILLAIAVLALLGKSLIADQRIKTLEENVKKLTK